MEEDTETMGTPRRGGFPNKVSSGGGGGMGNLDRNSTPFQGRWGNLVGGALKWGKEGSKPMRFRSITNSSKAGGRGTVYIWGKETYIKQGVKTSARGEGRCTPRTLLIRLRRRDTVAQKRSDLDIDR